MKAAYRIGKNLFDDSLKAELDSKLTSSSNLDWLRLVNVPQLANMQWRAPVQTTSSLPISGSVEGDVRLILSTSEMVAFKNGAWTLINTNDQDTTYTNITEEEIDNGISTISRVITGKSAKYIQDTTKIFSDGLTPPENTNQFWVDKN